MASLLSRTAESCILLLRGRPKVRFAILLYSLVALPTLLVFQFASGYWFGPSIATIARGIAPPLILLSLFSAAVSLIAYGPANPKKTQEQYELEEIRQRRREIQQRL